MVIKEYNLNLIDLNKILEENIELEISNFLYINNLDLKLNSRDLNNIFKHFILKEILSQLDKELNNILLFNFNFSLKYLQLIFDEEECKLIIIKILKKSTKIFNFIIHDPINFITKDLNLIYKLKCLINNKKPTNFKKIKSFVDSSNLQELSKKIKNDPQTKLSLNK